MTRKLHSHDGSPRSASAAHFTMRVMRRVTPVVAVGVSVALFGTALPSWGADHSTLAVASSAASAPVNEASAGELSSEARSGHTSGQTSGHAAPGGGTPGDSSAVSGAQSQPSHGQAHSSGVGTPGGAAVSTSHGAAGGDSANAATPGGGAAQGGHTLDEAAAASSPEGVGNGVDADTPASAAAPEAGMSEGTTPAGVTAPAGPSTSKAPTPRSAGRGGFRQGGGVLEAVFATGGAGRFKDTIQWLQWNDPNLYRNGNFDHAFPSNATAWPAQYVAIGSENTLYNPSNYRTTHTVKNARDLGEGRTLETTCTLSNLQHKTNSANNGALLMTVPGVWKADSFDNLYNVGGSKGASTDPDDPNAAEGNGVPHNFNGVPNRMVVGLATGIVKRGIRNQGGGTTVEFDLSCNAELIDNASRRTVPINGLVLADAESTNGNGNANPNQSREWVSATVPADVKWHLLDRIRDPGCTRSGRADTQFAVRSTTGDTQKVTMLTNKSECLVGLGNPTSVMFMEGTSSATIGMKGEGLGAVALGLVMTTDFGDAPSEYGSAVALFQPSWDGGELPNEPKIDVFSATLATPHGARYRLGDTTTHERTQPLGADSGAAAEGDGGGIGAEGADDALTSQDDLRVFSAPGGLVTRTIRCHGDGPVKGWIDWNVNRSFDEATEASNQVNCSNNTATLRWTIPADVKRAVPGETVPGEVGTSFRTYMRLRTAQPGEQLRPTGMTLGGEVEDYLMTVFQPTLELVKRIEPNSYDPNPQAFDRWSLSAQQGATTEAGRYFTAQGRLPVSTAIAGIFTLRESATDPGATAGYDSGQWECVETPGTIRAPGETYTSSLSGNLLALRGNDRVTCTITSSPKPGSLRWSKVEQDGTTPLDGSAWRLEGPSHTGGVRVEDCVAASANLCTGHDKDHRVGEFHITELIWGDYTITEVQAPTGYDAISTPLAFDTISATHLEATLVDVPRQVAGGKVINKRTPTSVVWRKTDTRGTGLGGSVWRITEPGGATQHSISDCTADPCPATPLKDTNPAPGEFRIVGLPWSDSAYTLTETTAPPGYIRDTSERTFTVNRTRLTADLGVITNEMVAVPAIPFTGGLSADGFLIAGGLASLIALSGALIGRRTRRQPADG